MTLQDAVRQAREARGLSIREAARRLGVHRQVLKRWERGDATPYADMDNVFRAVLGVDLFRFRVGAVEVES